MSDTGGRFVSIMRSRAARRFALLLILCAALTGAATFAETLDTPTDYPTLDALAEVVIPPADPVDLALRLRGLEAVPTPPVAPPALHVGDTADFWVTNDAASRTFSVTAVLQGLGQHAAFWVQQGDKLDDDHLTALIDAFDTRIYEPVRALWGSEANPGVDGDPRLHVLFARDLGPGTAAYFARRHTYPASVFPFSNAREMFFVNLDVYGPTPHLPSLESTLAHEFQHMIRANVDPNEDTWLNEGFSTFTEHYLGYAGPQRFGQAFLRMPHVQLNDFSYVGPNMAASYGAGFLFVTYFHERYGVDAVRALSLDAASGLASVENTLRALGEPGADAFFADWVVANVAQNTIAADGRYGYASLPALGVPRILDQDDTNGQTRLLAQYGTDYHLLTDVEGAAALEISLAMPPSVPLVATDPVSGAWMWYSLRGDASNMTLTRAFDLRAVDSAALHYSAWFDIEEGWDYAYLSVSTDGGLTWDILPTAHTSDYDPHGNAYGPGYTGYSDGWVREQVSLDAYAGLEVLLRFEMITDDAINYPGLVIDDVSLPAVGYHSDFEDDGGGWEAAGWVRTDNRLPQRAWVQVIEWGDDPAALTVTRWRYPDDGDGWTLPLQPDTGRVVIAVSPFAPVTTEPGVYALDVTVVAVEALPVSAGR